MDNVIGTKGINDDYSFSYSASEMNSLFGKIAASEIFTSEEKQKLSELENYNDSEMQALISNLTETIASLEARIAVLETNGGESENET